MFSFQEVNFTVLDTAEAGTNGHGLLNGIEKLLTSVFIPSLRKLDKGWGQLDNKAGQTTKVDFLNSLDAFVAVLSGRKYRDRGSTEIDLVSLRALNCPKIFHCHFQIITVFCCS